MSDPAVREILADVAMTAQAFASRHALACPPGCGACCANPGVYARVAEMVPAAEKLLASGEADHFYSRAEEFPDGTCVLYAPGEGVGRGRCLHYDVRPGLCRMFGAAVRRDKYDRPEFLTCGVLREVAPDGVAAATAEVLAPRNESGAWPEFRRLDEAIIGAAGSAALIEFLPINRALRAALILSVHRVADRQQRDGDRGRSPCKPELGGDARI